MLKFALHRDRPRTLDARLRGLAEKWPDRVALEIGNERTTYAALLATGKAVAGTLQGLPKWHREPVVVVLGRPGAARVHAMVGAWLAGLVVAPIDPDLPPAVLAGAIKDLQPQAICVDDTCLSTLPAILPELPSGLAVLVENAQSVRPVEALGHGNPVHAIDRRAASRWRLGGARDADVAVHFWLTKGGGGTWVPRSHGDLLEDADRHIARYNVRPGERVSALHDLDGHRGVIDLVIPWSIGGTACAPDPAAPGGAVAWLRRARLTLLRLTPTRLRQLETLKAVTPQTLGTLRVVVLEGEGHRGKDVVGLRAAVPEAVIDSVFGRTEAGSALLVHRVQPGPHRADNDPVPLGRAFDGVRLAVVDPAGFPVKPGTPGLLAFATSRGQVVRTGDRVKAVRGLGLKHLGRGDDMIQLDGRRVSLDTVGNAIEAVTGSAAVVVGWPMAAPGSAQGLVGFVQAGQVDAGAVRAALRERLPKSLVPAELLAVPGLPRREDGGPDRVRLMRFLAGRPAR